MDDLTRDATTDFANDNPEAYKAVELFCEWINKWIEEDDPEGERVTIDNFFKYGETSILSDVTLFPDNTWRNWRHIIIQAGYGDDGGPSTLYCVYSNFGEDEGWELVHILQEFDTNFTIIYGQVPFGRSDRPSLRNYPGTIEQRMNDDMQKYQDAMDAATPSLP